MESASKTSKEKQTRTVPDGNHIGPVFGLKEILLFCVGYFQERKGDIKSVDKKKLCLSMGIKPDTLNKRLSAYRREGLLSKDKNQGTCGYLLTPEGRKLYGVMYDIISRTPLIPELHDAEGLLGDVINSLMDPVNIIKVVLNVMLGQELDVIAVYHEELSRRPGYKDRILLKELVDADGTLDMPFEIMVEKFTLMGKKPEDFSIIDSAESILDATIAAELLRRRLKEDEAYRIFKEILQSRSGKIPAYRIFSVVGLIHCIKVKNNHNDALEITENFLAVTKHPAYRVMLNKCKADILSYSDLDAAKCIYHSCLKSLRTLKLRLLETAILNNLGIVYFKQSNIKEAEDCWSKSLKISKDYDLPWIEAVTKMNISDPIALSGNIERAKKLLNESKIFLEKVKDLEGLSGYYFNMALVNIEEGNKDLALEHFKLCDEYPLNYKEKREDRWNEMNKRFSKKGWEFPFPFQLFIFKKPKAF